MKKSTLLAVCATVLLFFGSTGSGWGQYIVNFEGTGETKTAYASGTVNLSGINWDMTEALIGTETAEIITGTRSARLRGHGTSSMTMLANKSNGIGSISFNYRRYGIDGQVDWKVEYSTNDGTSWTQIGSPFTAPADASIHVFNETVNVNGNIRIRIKRATETGSTNKRLNIDDITVSDYSAGSPTITVTGTFSNFSTTAGTPSASQSVAVSGANLTANIAVSAVNGYEYSTTNAAPWTSTLSLASSFNGNVYVRLTGASAGTYSGTIAFSSTGATTVNKAVTGTVTPPPPANDNCSGAIALTLDATAVTGDVTGATQSIAALSCGGYTGTADDDVWYTFTTNSAGPYTITVVGSASFDAVVDLRSGACDGINIDCADASTTGGGTETITTALSAATTYLVRVYSYDAAVPATTTFTIGVATATSPTISVSTSSLTGFTYVQGSGPSTEQTFTVEGVNLTANLTVSPSTDYEVSLTSGSGYSTPISLTPSSGTVVTTTIYVRLKAGLTAGDYNAENIAASSTGAATQNVVCSGTVTAPLTTLPLYEEFNYAAGTLLTANGWTAHSGAGSNAITVAAGSIVYSGYLSSGIGNEVALGASGEDVNRIFTAQTTGTVYASFLVNVSAATTTGDYFFHLGETTIGTTFRGRVFVKKDASDNLAFGIAHSSTPVNYTAYSYALNTPYLIVLKFDIVNGTANDVSSIYINPPLNSAIPATGWLANTDVSGTDLDGVGSVALRQGGAYAPTLKLDGMRISTSWADIVGAIPPPTISGFLPTSGCSNGGTSVTITGTNFTDATAVTFNGTNAASFVVVDATQITAVTPSGVTTGKIAVTTPGGTVQSAGDFTVTQSVTPAVTIVASANPVTSGTSVAITATPVNGGTTPMYQLYINGTASGPLTSNSSISIAPPAGTYSIHVVMTPDPTLPCFSPATATSNTIILVVNASPATSTWTGSGNDHNWHNAANWNNGVPGSTTAVTIPSGLGTNYPTVSSSAICASITIESGASLINNGLLGITGQATVKREISDASDDNWHLFISPITQNIAATASSCFNGAYLDRYDEPSGEWVRLVTGDNVVPGYGYSINYLSGSRDLVFTGTLKNSPLTYSSLSYSSGAPGYGAGWHLIGNPYPCGINPSLCAAPSGMNAYAYVWDNAGSGNYLTPQFGSSTTIIAPLQGFFVRTTSATNSLTLANNAKTHGGTFYKNENAESEALVVKISGNNYSDQTIVRFNRDATTNFDQSYDAYKLWGLDAAPQLYSILPDENAAVNTLPAVDANPLVPLGLKVGAETSYTLTVEGMESFDSQIPLRLDDLKLGISKDLRTDPVYSFTAAPGDAENRFRLRFASAIGFDDPEASNILINTERNIIRVNYLGSSSGIIHLYNDAGQLLSTKSLNRGETTMSAEATGIYLVKVITGKSVITKKVVVVR